MSRLKRTLYWLIAACGVVLAIFGLWLVGRAVFSSTRAGIAELLEFFVILAAMLYGFALDKPGIFMAGLLGVAACFTASLLLLRYLAQTPRQRSSAKWFVIAGITGGLIGASAVFMGVMAGLAGI